MPDALTPELATRLIIAIIAVGIGLLALVAILGFLRRRNSPLFIKGGRAREPRLLVLDAAAIDAKRRLVLIRRDDVEHLVMIGGPTDIVIETGIGVKAEVVVATLPEAKALSIAQTQPLPPARAEQPAPTRPTAAPVVPEPAARPANSVPLAVRTIAQDVSAAGSVLYDEDREPMTGQKDAAPLAAQAENALDMARERLVAVRAEPPAVTNITVGKTDPAKELEAKLEAAKRESAMRLARAQAQAAELRTRSAMQQQVPPASVPVAAPVPASAEPAGERLSSDFEKLLEAELQAGGLFDTDIPVIQTGPRDQGPELAPGQAEKDMARLLGEMAASRKI